MTQFIPPVALGGSGIVYSDDGSGARDMLAGGHRTWFIPVLGEVITLANSALSSANSAVGSANASGTSTTSISTPTIGSDTVTITTQTGKLWVPGMTVIVANSAAPYTQWLTGFVKTYTGSSLVITVADYGGSAAWPGASWTISSGALPRPALITYAAQIAASITLTIGDRGKLIDFTGTTSSTINFPAAATAAAGWYVYIRNATSISAGYSVTLDPNSAETIDSLATYKMYPGETRLIVCTGSVWQSIVLTPYSILATSTFTFTKPPGYKAHRVRLWGGGGSGGGGRGSSGALARPGGGGAGGGMYVEAVILDADAGTGGTVTVAAAQTTVGAGGNGVYGSGGTNGGSTSLSFGVTSLIAAGGSAGGAGSPTLYLGGAGGAPAEFAAADQLFAGSVFQNFGALAGKSAIFSGGGASGGGGNSSETTDAAAGGSSIYGGGGGASGRSIENSGTVGAGAAGGACLSGTATYPGAGGASGAAGAAGGNGSIPGGGGAGGSAGTSVGGAGGQGAAGMAIISGQ